MIEDKYDKLNLYQQEYSIPQNPTEDDSRKARAKKYKEYLDLQIQLKNDKIEYEKNNKLQTNKIYQQRNAELDKIEKESILKNQIMKNKLAEVYKRQIEEQETIRRGHSVDRAGQNDFCGFADINRKRYLKVTKTLKLAP